MFDYDYWKSTEIEYSDESYLKEKMYEYRDEAVERISSNVAHFSKDFALILAYSYFNDYEPAVKLADQLNLSKLEMLALQENFLDFRQEYIDYQVR